MQQHVVLACVEGEGLLVDEVDGDQRPDAVTNIIATMIQGSKEGSDDLQRPEAILDLLILMELSLLRLPVINLDLSDGVVTGHSVHCDPVLLILLFENFFFKFSKAKPEVFGGV